MIHSNVELEPHLRTLNAIEFGSGFGFGFDIYIAFDWSSRESQIWT